MQKNDAQINIFIREKTRSLSTGSSPRQAPSFNISTTRLQATEQVPGNEYIKTGGIRIMMEPTLTQNSALYFVQHKVSIPRASLFQRFAAAARKRSSNVSQAQLRGNLFRWPRIHWGKRG